MKRIISLLTAFVMFITAFSGFTFNAQAKKKTAKTYTVSYTVEQNYNYANIVYKLVNTERKKKKIKKLKYNKELCEYAMQRASELALSFSHTRPDGTDCLKGMKKVHGENIQMGAETPREVMDTWMHSKGHKRNILTKKYKYIGVGCVYINGVYYWTQIFSNSKFKTSKKKGIVNKTRKVKILKKKAFFEIFVPEDYNFEDTIYGTQNSTINLGVNVVLSSGDYLSEMGRPALKKGMFTFTSSDESVMKIKSDGTAQLLSNGKVTVTAYSKKLKKKVKKTYNLELDYDSNGGDDPFYYDY